MVFRDYLGMEQNKHELTLKFFSRWNYPRPCSSCMATKPKKIIIDLTKPPQDQIDLTQPRQRAHPFISYRTGNNPDTTSNTEISNLDMDYDFLSQQSENDDKDNDIDNDKQISPSKKSDSKKKTQKGKWFWIDIKPILNQY